ncbi:MAG TPA: PD-(D/E)XK nuclease family protein, partial [Tepidisphaeraceae bacterium]|nr:PD-(D/E)XK nuclease family protein [Tepidisphaeraceae bacterium]
SLLVLENFGEQLIGRKLTPKAAFYLEMVRSFADVEHPDMAFDPGDERYLLANKPRGLFDARALSDLDGELETGRSMVVHAYVKKDGTLGHVEKSDSIYPEEFAAVLQMVRRRIAALSDEVLSGKISITPYRLERRSPCATCEFRGVCRFETPINRYNHLQPLKREQVMQNIRREESHGK